MKNQLNKDIIRRFYKEVIGKRDATFINKLVREDYIQHSPNAKDGREGLLEMVNFLKALLPPKERLSPIKMLIADGDLVAGLMDIKFMGKRMLVVDLFRVKDGMLAEHWDAVQQIDEDVLIDDMVVDERVSDMHANKALVANRLESQVRRVIGEGNIVLAQSAITVHGRLYASYDIYRFTDGDIMKHLNVRQQVPDTMLHNNGMM